MSQERRFAKLGKAAATIVEAYPMLRLILDETTTTNQLIEACKIYTELETLAYFIEKNSQTELCTLLPQLYHDLLQKKTDTLKDYIVNIRSKHLQVKLELKSI